MKKLAATIAGAALLGLASMTAPAAAMPVSGVHTDMSGVDTVQFRPHMRHHRKVCRTEKTVRHGRHGRRIVTTRRVCR
ncbi:MAG: hypothetical protein AB7F39_02385 [Variibacter sp.]